MTDAKLQPCPFCGEHLTQDSRMMMASCGTADCYMHGLAVDLDDADSVERWNRRANTVDAALKLAEERLAKAAKALKPFANCVFNDNGDVTISHGDLTWSAFSDAYYILKEIDNG